MVTRTAALAALALTLALGAPPAQADTTAPAPLTLDSYSFRASVSSPPKGQPVTCDRNNFVYCGFVSVDVVLSGFDGRERPGPTEYQYPLSTTGEVDVTRVYGCATAKGRRLHRFDTRVVQRDVAIQNRRNIPYPVPAEDSRQFGAYALLADAQPGNCPRGTKPRLYRLVAENAELTLESTWAGIPASTTYEIPGRACWRGAARTPELA